MNLNPSTSLFAKLLAEENLHVRVDRTLSTAAFEPETRTLLLPNLSDFDSDAWLLFVAHEVGHAKYTPQDSFSRPDVRALASQYGADRVRLVINVLEDIRIERQIRARYQGLAGVFAKGYRSLLAQHFFGKSADEIQQTHPTASLLDRLNLYAKVGALLHLTLVRPADIRWYNAAARAASFDEILTIARDILSSQESQPQPQPQPPQGQPQQQPPQGQPQSSPSQGQPQQDQPASAQGASDAANAQPGEQEATPDSGEASTEPGPTSEATGAAGVGAAAGSVDDLTSETMQAAEQFLRHAKFTAQASDARTVVLPASFDALRQNDVTLEQVLSGWTMPTDRREVLCDLVRRQRKDASSVLASMVNTFRMYQSAWQSRREESSRTGLLDMTKLSQHKLTDDIFLRRTEVPNAKNHGLVLFIDWSASMESTLATVLSQVLHLIWFAEQIGVPVNVYAFTDVVRKESYASTDGTTATGAFQRYVVDRQPSLVEYYRADASPTTKLNAQAYLLAEILLRGNIQYTRANYEYAGRTGDLGFLSSMPVTVREAATTIVTDEDFWSSETHAYHSTLLTTNPRVHRLGGTPLHSAVLASSDYVRAFRAKHRVEQCVSVWLTDGEDGNGIPSCYSPEQMMLGERTGQWQVPASLRSDDIVLADPTFGRTYRPRKGTTQFSQVLDAHRTRTGATVLVVDITDRPTASYNRLIAETTLREYANDLQGEAIASVYGRRRRHGYLKHKAVKQTRRAVVLPSSKKSFPETGVFAIDQRDVPALACDAMLVSHPSWWFTTDEESSSEFDRRAVKRVLDDEALLSDDDTTADAAEHLTRRVKLQSALLSNSRAIGMRKFADLIVPFIATGRDDATV